MSWNRTYFAVTTRHPVKGSRWDGEHLFCVNADEGYTPRRYYASAEAFGCGKTHTTPEGAIAILAQDNAAEVVSLSYQHEDEI